MVTEALRKALIVSRPIFWPIAPAAYLFGVSAGGGEIGVLAIVQAFLLSVPLGIFVFGINDLFDIESDGANPRRKGVLWGAKVQETDKRWIFFSSATVVLLIILSALASMEPAHIIVTALFLPFPVLYSAPPFRLKSRPVLDSLTNATYTYAPFAMGYSLSGGLGFLDINMILFAMVFSAAHAIGTIMDLPGDSKAGIRTFASSLGPRAAAAFALAILLINLPFAFSSMKSIFLVIAAYAMASFYVLIRPSPENAKGCFIVMVLSITIWLIYAGLGAGLGLWEIA
jgi:4-hydroxybenzoate polyprenyltransferase